MNDLPIGAAVNATAAERPGPVKLQGRFCRIEKLDPGRHGADLWRELKGNDHVWTYMAYGPFADGRAFANWLDKRAMLLDPYSCVVADAVSGQALGIVSLMETRPTMRVIEMGGIVYSPALQRTRAATEAQYLAARYVFDDLGYRRYEWKCNALNAPSMTAAKRLGFTYEGTFRQHLIVKGRNRDTAWFSITNNEWPAVKAAFERWLAPKNFDGTGKQKASLAALRSTREKT
ncbi:MAG TPA: GNAT family protein [Bauldia sp.]|jgi:RimJ/RimL family protein N-acetyltransferase